MVIIYMVPNRTKWAIFTIAISKKVLEGISVYPLRSAFLVDEIPMNNREYIEEFPVINSE